MTRIRTLVGDLVVPIAILVGTAPLSAQDTDSVRISVVEDHLYGRAAYRYRVENNSRTRAVVAFRIGDDHRESKAELKRPPYGWTDDKGLPLGSAVAPDGWAVEALREDAEERWFVEWFSSEADDAFDIAPGEMRDGFAVMVSDTAPEYLDSHWTVVFDNGARVSGRVERDSR